MVLEDGMRGENIFVFRELQVHKNLRHKMSFTVRLLTVKTSF